MSEAPTNNTAWARRPDGIPELRRSANWAAFFFIPMADLMPVEHAHEFSFHRELETIEDRIADAVFQSAQEPAIYGRLDVWFKFHRHTLPTADVHQQALSIAASQGWSDDWGIDDTLHGWGLDRFGHREIGVVEALVPFDIEPDEVPSAELSDLLPHIDDARSRMFAALSRLQRAINSAVPTLMKPTSEWTCPVDVVLFGVRNTDSGRTILPLQPLGLRDQWLRRSEEARLEQHRLDADEWAAVEAILEQQDNASPIARSLDLHADAFTAALIDGNSVAGIVLLQMSTEVLVSHALRTLHWESGMSPQDYERNYIRQFPTISSLLTKHLPDLIGGTWQKNHACPYREWDDACKSLRNRVAHRGYTPRVDEIDRALEATWALEDYLLERLRERSRSLPLSACLISDRLLRPIDNAQVEAARTHRGHWETCFARWSSFVDAHDAPTDYRRAILTAVHSPNKDPVTFWHWPAEFCTEEIPPAARPLWLQDSLSGIRDRPADSPTLVQVFRAPLPSGAPANLSNEHEFLPDLFPIGPEPAPALTTEHVLIPDPA